MNEGAAEGVAMEGNDRRGKTCSSRKRRLSEISESLFFYSKFLKERAVAGMRIYAQLLLGIKHIPRVFSFTDFSDFAFL